ncbi:hypothetical protein ACWDUD_14585 [Rhodococcus sp. NPDC003382]
MKLTVIVGPDGQVIGTAHHIDSEEGSGTGGPIAGPGQSVLLIDVPPDVENVHDVDELYRSLERIIRSGTPK